MLSASSRAFSSTQPQVDRRALDRTVPEQDLDDLQRIEVRRG